MAPANRPSRGKNDEPGNNQTESRGRNTNGGPATLVRRVSQAYVVFVDRGDTSDAGNRRGLIEPDHVNLIPAVKTDPGNIHDQEIAAHEIGNNRLSIEHSQKQSQFDEDDDNSHGDARGRDQQTQSVMKKQPEAESNPRQHQ